MRRTFIAGLLLMGLTGCFQTQDELTIHADGSGKVRIETRLAAGANLAAASAMGAAMGGQGAVIYPPVSPEEAKKFFPGKDFKITAKQTNAQNGDTVTVIDVEFKDINSLLASPYGRAHQLSVELDKDGLAVKGVTGMELAARMADVKSEGGMGAMEMMEMQGMAGGDMQKRAGEMRAEFRITLPNAVSTSNGARDGKTAAWTVERAKSKDAADFARQLGVVAEARCAADGLNFIPLTPLRLGLQPFAQLTPGAGASKAPSLDTNKIAGAVKFVPYGLTVTRAVDLSGQGGMNESGAQLIGAVVAPREFAPQKFGEPALQEAVDAKGNDLKPKASADGEFSGMRYRNYGGRDEEADADDEDAPTAAADLRHVVTFSFRAPDWKVKEVARVKGSVALHYFSGAEVVKLTNAIPANWIMNMTQAMGGGAMDMSEKHLNSPRLAELGLVISLEEGMSQSGMTTLQLEIKGAKAALLDAQAFDADGKPWPTFLISEGGAMGDESSCQLIIAGSPKPPLSLAFTASGTSSTVEVPVLVEHAPLTAE